MIKREDMRIYIDNLTETVSGNDPVIEHQLSDIADFVTQYRFQGGPEQPIRYLEMAVDKNDIDEAYPHLIDSIVEGKTRLLIDAVDGGTFIITKIWLKNNSYDLVATGIEITLNTATLSSGDIDALYPDPDDPSTWIIDPPSIVKALFDRWKDTLNLTDSQSQYAQGSPTYEDDYQIFFSKSYAGSTSDVPRPPSQAGYTYNQISFKEDMPTLVAMNMCALLDKAFIFFANLEGVNTLYYVAYDDINPLAFQYDGATNNGTVNIYPGLNSQYQQYTKFDLMMFQRLVGISSKNSEGSETIVNNQIVSMDGGEGYAYNDPSIAMYGDYAGTKVMSDLMRSYEYDGSDTATRIASSIVERYKDPTRSITFTLSEVVTDEISGTSGWEGQIPPFSYANRIVDSVNKITLTNYHLCDNQPNKFLLRLSTFIRMYPEMMTEYTFGVMKETTLSQELANKLTGMTGNVADLRIGNTSIVRNGVAQVDTEPSQQDPDPAHLITSHGVYEAIDDAMDTLNGNIATAVSNVMQALYPVGSIYINASNPANPNTLFGFGTWEAIGEGNVLLSGSQLGTYRAGNPYGSNTTNKVPKHTHSFTTDKDGGHTHKLYINKDVSDGKGWNKYCERDTEGSHADLTTSYDGEHRHTGTTDSTGDDSVSIMQQSIAVYMWKRTA